MKVCTDACLFGAWVANDVDIQKFENILDIGTGTGLLSLMIAQALESNIPKTQITAVEIESGAAKEAESNFTLSPWASNLQIVHSSVQAYSNQIKQAENVEKYLYDYNCGPLGKSFSDTSQNYDINKMIEGLGKKGVIK